MSKIIFKAGLVSIFLKAFGALLSVLTAAFLGRTLGVDGFGAYAYVLAILTLVALPSQAGLPQLVARETARRMACNDYSRVMGVWRWAGMVALSLSGAIFLVILTIYIVDERLLGDYSEIYLAGCLLPAMMALASIRSAALLGLKLIVLSLLADSVVRPVTFLILILIFMETYKTLSADIAIFLHFLSLLFSFIFGAYLIYRYRPWKNSEAIRPLYENRIWISALVPLSMITGFRIINSQVDLIFLGLLASTQDVGLYKAMLVLSASLLLPLQAINGVISPYMTIYHERGEVIKLQQLVVISTIASFLLMLFPFSIFSIWGEDIIALVYGLEFKSGYWALLVLILGQMVNVSVGPVALLLNMTGHERYTMRGVGVSTFLNIILTIILIPEYGVLGAAFASAVTMIGWNLMLWYFVRKKLGIDGSVINFRSVSLAQSHRVMEKLKASPKRM